MHGELPGLVVRIWSFHCLARVQSPIWELLCATAAKKKSGAGGEEKLAIRYWLNSVTG